MGAEREPGATTTCRTPPSSNAVTAILAAAMDVRESWEVTVPVYWRPPDHNRALTSCRFPPDALSHRAGFHGMFSHIQPASTRCSLTSNRLPRDVLSDRKSTRLNSSH